jgi:hypothetical protein
MGRGLRVSEGLHVSKVFKWGVKGFKPLCIAKMTFCASLHTFCQEWSTYPVLLFNIAEDCIASQAPISVESFEVREDAFDCSLRFTPL